jgi:hypothetical protein
MRIKVEIAPGELFDKLTILGIKLEKIKDNTKIVFVKNEQAILKKSVSKLHEWVAGNKIANSKALNSAITKLRQINEKIWDIEDKIRDCERRQDFGDKFVQLARSVYLTNDERARIKKEINEFFDSDIREEKSYTDYEAKDVNHVEECNRLVKEHNERNRGQND